MKITVWMLAALLPATWPAGATASDLQPESLDRMIVTATRSQIDVDDALVPVIVIDRETIAASGAADLADLLRFHEGLEIARNGGPGQTTSVFMRGTDSNHTLVLIDGVEMNPGTLGGAAVQNISAQSIERVEIVKGPRSSLYGSEAIGGVINVITRAAGQDSAFGAQIGGGRYGSRDLQTRADFQGETAGISIVLDHSEADGYPTQSGSDIDRGYTNTSLSMRGKLQMGGWGASVSHWQARGNTEYLDFFLAPLDQDYENRVTELRLDLPTRGIWQSDVSLARSVDDIEQNQSDDFVRTERDTFDWQNEFGLQHQRIVAGATLGMEDTSAISFGSILDDGNGDSRISTDVYELYVADHIESGPHSGLLAARYTEHETFGDHLTWNAEYGFAIGGHTRLSAGAGTAFRAPDSTDRFGFGGNADLQPEVSASMELGLRHRIDEAQRVTLQAFQTDIDDLIEYVVTDPLTFFGENRNVARARIRGVELGYRLLGARWDVRVSGILQDTENRDTGMQLLRRARENLTASVQRHFGAHRVGLDMLAAGDREDFGFPAPVRLPGYELLNLTGTLALSGQWTLRGRLENLLDERYETAAGFPAPGRGLYLQLGYTLKPGN